MYSQNVLFQWQDSASDQEMFCVLYHSWYEAKWQLPTLKDTTPQSVTVVILWLRDKAQTDKIIFAMFSRKLNAVKEFKHNRFRATRLILEYIFWLCI